MSSGDLPGRRTTVKHWPGVGEVCISLAAWVNIYYVRRVCTADIACYAAGDARAIPMSGPVVSPRRSRNTTRMTWRDSTTTEIIIIYYIIITILLCSLFGVASRVLCCSGLINIIWIVHDVVVLHLNYIRKRSRSTELLCFATEELWISLLTIHVVHDVPGLRPENYFSCRLFFGFTRWVWSTPLRGHFFVIREYCTIFLNYKSRF